MEVEDPQERGESEERENPPVSNLKAPERVVPNRGGSEDDPGAVVSSDAPPCMNCGSLMIQAGACHVCPTCGESGGCG